MRKEEIALYEEFENSDHVIMATKLQLINVQFNILKKTYGRVFLENQPPHIYVTLLLGPLSLSYLPISE